jgi:hypothetical protein
VLSDSTSPRATSLKFSYEQANKINPPSPFAKAQMLLLRSSTSLIFVAEGKTITSVLLPENILIS